jgi:hypothetical protein
LIFSARREHPIRRRERVQGWIKTGLAPAPVSAPSIQGASRLTGGGVNQAVKASEGVLRAPL